MKQLQPHQFCFSSYLKSGSASAVCSSFVSQQRRIATECEDQRAQCLQQLSVSEQRRSKSTFFTHTFQCSFKLASLTHCIVVVLIEEPNFCFTYVLVVTSMRYVAGINHEARGRTAPEVRVIYSGNVPNHGRDISNLSA